MDHTFGAVARIDPFRGEFWLSKWGTAVETLQVLQNKPSKYRRKKPIKLMCTWDGSEEEVRFERVAGKAAIDLVIEVLLDYVQLEQADPVAQHTWSLEHAKQSVIVKSEDVKLESLESLEDATLQRSLSGGAGTRVGVSGQATQEALDACDQDADLFLNQDLARVTTEHTKIRVVAQSMPLSLSNETCGGDGSPGEL